VWFQKVSMSTPRKIIKNSTGVIRGSNVKRKVWIYKTGIFRGLRKFKTANSPWERMDKIMFWTNTLQEHVAVDDPGFCIIKHSPLNRTAAQQTVTLNNKVLYVPYRPLKLGIEETEP